VKILITHSYFYKFDPKQWRLSKPYPPFATLLMASVLRNLGHEVYFFDVSFASSAGELIPSLDEFSPDIFMVYDDGFNYLSKMCLTNMRDAACLMASEASRRNIKTIISSSDSSDHPEHYLHNGFHYVVQGEAEEAVSELVAALQSGQSPVSVPNLCFFDNSQLQRNSKRKVKTNLDEFPFAAWDLLDIRPYKQAWRKHGYFSMNMATTRGCPFKCNWCAKPIYGNRYNSRSPEHVVEELKLMHKLFAFDHVWFCDDIFGLKPGWVSKFSSLIAESGITFRYKIQSRVDLLLQEQTITELKNSGCEEVWVGAESGSQKILDAMDKGTTVAQIREATLLMKQEGLKPCFFLQFGYPGEMKEDIQATVEMLFELNPFDIGVSVSYPLPGTGFYDKVKGELMQKSNWTDSDELLLMFRNTYSPAYYKSLHRYVHRRFRASQALEFSPDTAGLKKFFSWFYFAPASWLEKVRMSKLENHVEAGL